MKGIQVLIYTNFSVHLKYFNKKICKKILPVHNSENDYNLCIFSVGQHQLFAQHLIEQLESRTFSRHQAIKETKLSAYHK